MSGVLLVGYYGMQNTGDDALLAAASWGARRVFRDVRVLATAASIPNFPGSNRVVPIYPKAQRYPGQQRLSTALAAVRSTSVLFGGGSVFHDDAGLGGRYGLLRIAGRGPHIAAGVSLGPFRSSRSERAAARLLRALAFTGVRDAESLAVGRSLAPEARIELTFDLAALLPMLAPGAHAAGSRGRSLGIAVCDYERFTGGDRSHETVRRTKLAAILSSLDRSLVDEVVFLDFNGHPEYGDAAMHAELRRSVPPGIAVRHEPYRADPIAMLRLIGSLGAVLAMRLHASVFAFLGGTPCVSLSYHPKCIGWARQIGAPDEAVHDSVTFDPQAVTRSIHDALTARLPLPQLSVSEASRRALRNFPEFEA